MSDPHIVVVGASLGGLRTVESLRALAVTSSITVVGEETYMPYNRPPLSKEFLQAGADGQRPAPESLFFKVKATLGDVAWRLGRRAEEVELSKGVLRLEDGTRFTFDALVVATGLRPRRLSIPGAVDQRFTCRTVEDALAIRNRVRPGTEVVIAGAGFIGCEIAATLSKLGAKVTIVEPFGLPMERSLGRSLATAFMDYHSEQSVAFRIGRSITGIVTTRHDTISHVELDNGERLQADIIIEALGSLSNVEWLAGNGLDLSDGILCDRDMKVEGRDNVVGVGDVARFPNDFIGPEARRTEHWCVPGQTAKRAAETLAIWMGKEIAREKAFAPLPSFWSDQYGMRIQAFGSAIGVNRWEQLEGEASAAGLPQGVAIGGYVRDRMAYVVTVGLPPAKSIMYRNMVVQKQSELLPQ